MQADSESSTGATSPRLSPDRGYLAASPSSAALWDITAAGDHKLNLRCGAAWAARR